MLRYELANVSSNNVSEAKKLGADRLARPGHVCASTKSRANQTEDVLHIKGSLRTQYVEAKKRRAALATERPNLLDISQAP